MDPSLMRGQFTNATLIPAQAYVRIPVRTLKSGKTSMDTLVYQALNLSSYPNIEYHLETLRLTQAPEGANGPWLFDSTGSLVLHGTTNITSFPIVITEAGGKLNSSGSLSLKLSDYGIKAPEPFLDEVRVSFEWITERGGS
jgi:polyisoprenoid-binding protein YceI